MRFDKVIYTLLIVLLVVLLAMSAFSCKVVHNCPCRLIAGHRPTSILDSQYFLHPLGILDSGASIYPFPGDTLYKRAFIIISSDTVMRKLIAQ